MINYSREAVLSALARIQEAGYAVVSPNPEEIEILWIRQDDPPDVEPMIHIIESSRDILESALRDFTWPLPLWLLLGYPWDHSIAYWENMYRS